MSAYSETSDKKVENKKKISKLIKEKMRARKIRFALFMIVCLSLAFVLGFAFRSQVSLMSSLGIPIGEESQLNVLKTKARSDDVSKKTVKTVYNSISARIDEVEDIISANSLASIDVDSSTRAQINAMLESTGDKYAKYYDADEYSTLLNESKSTQYIGIGLTINEVDGKCYVADVFEGSEAQIKGVKAGDAIKTINSEDVSSKSSAEINSKITSSNEQSLIINFFRPNSAYGDSGKNYTCSLEVKSQNVENVTTTIIDGVCFVNIHQFSDGTCDVLKQKVAESEAQDVSAYVIDVRDNPGGYLTGALDCASAFVKSGTLLTIQTSQSSSDRTADGKTITEKPIVLLINSNTSGAAEAFASALRDNNRASLVGKISAGKGVVAATRELTFGGAIRYSAAQYVTAKGNEIQGNGVKPDISYDEINDAKYDDNSLKEVIESSINISLS